MSDSKFMSSLTQDGAVNEEQLSVEQLDRVYRPLRQQVANSVHRQEAALDQIQVVLTVCPSVFLSVCLSFTLSWSYVSNFVSLSLFSRC